MQGYAGPPGKPGPASTSGQDRGDSEDPVWAQVNSEHGKAGREMQWLQI